MLERFPDDSKACVKRHTSHEPTRMQMENPLFPLSKHPFRPKYLIKIFDIWDDFSNERNTAAQLLKQCARLNSPSRVLAQRSNK